MTEPTLEMVLAGARSIGRTMRWENHNDRSRACWKAMIAASEGIEEPRLDREHHARTPLRPPGHLKIIH